MSSKNSNETFDQGASEAMATTEFSSGVYEAPQGVSTWTHRPYTSYHVPNSLTQSTRNDQEAAKAQGEKPGKMEEGKASNGIAQKTKDTAGASAMVL
ncbi:hypothetical protein F5Y12DRAFT_740407 [Xylaria sp. FL1777]|nr:hypothetical protein F5Y12DRAFT_740407 [Xylaria sp. FL1777]